LQHYIEDQELLAQIKNPTKKHVETEESYYTSTLSLC